MKRFFLGGILPVFLLACNASAPDYATVGNGELQNGSFAYLCVNPSDAFCAGTENVGLVPPGIAVGSTFRLAFTPAPGEAPATLALLGTTMLRLAADGTIHADHVGYASVFALDAAGNVQDYVDLRVQTVSAVAIIGADAMTTLKPSDTRAVRGQQLADDGSVLAGTGVWDWETSDASVVAIDTVDEERARGSATLRAVGPGTARVRVIVGSAATTTIDIVVGS